MESEERQQELDEEFTKEEAQVEEALKTLEGLLNTKDGELEPTAEEVLRLLHLSSGLYLLLPLFSNAWAGFLKDIKSGARKRLPFEEAYELFKKELREALEFILRHPDEDISLLEPDWRRIIESESIQMLGWALDSYAWGTTGLPERAISAGLLNDVVAAFEQMSVDGDFLGMECIAYPELCPNPKECPYKEDA